MRISLWSVALLTALAAIGLALLYPAATTESPALDTPRDHAILRVHPNEDVPLSFIWTHGSNALEIPRRMKVDYFVLCIFDARDGACNWPPGNGGQRSQQFTWTESIGSIVHSRLGNSLSDFNPWMDHAYIYTFGAAVSELDLMPWLAGRWLSWSVGACNLARSQAETSEDNCSFSASRQIGFTALDLHVTALYAEISGQNITINATIGNGGHILSGPVSVRIAAWPIIVDSECRIRTDIHSAGFDDDAEIVIKNQGIIHRNNLRPGYTILGIRNQSPSISEDYTVGNGLRPGEDIQIDSLFFEAPTDEPTALVLFVGIDMDNQLVEYDERNNRLTTMMTLGSNRESGCRLPASL